MKETLGLPDKSKEKLVLPAKRPSKKKPKDKPKRPLSAYNFFFKEEREKILKVVLGDDDNDKTVNDPESEDYLDTEALKRLRKEGGKVSFEEMGKLIGQRWKKIDPDRLTKFSEMATDDTERYKKEMAEYNGRQELKMRNEALKPTAAGFARPDMKGGMGGMPDGRYPEGINSAFNANGGYYGGMEFQGGYPMGMGGMYGYGGYPVPPQGADGRMEGGQYGPPPGMYDMMGGGGQYGQMMGYR